MPSVAASPIRPEIEPKRLRPNVSTMTSGTREVVTPAVRPKAIKYATKEGQRGVGTAGASFRNITRKHCRDIRDLFPTARRSDRRGPCFWGTEYGNWP